jgi:hypothetical protein
MPRLAGITIWIGLAVLACAPALTTAATPATVSAPTPGLPDVQTFVKSVRSGAIDPESYDFERAGFFDLPPQARKQWQTGVFGALGWPGRPGDSLCTTVARRNGAAAIWVQIAGQSTSADEWQATASGLRARLAEVDQMLKRSAPEKASAEPLVRELLARYAKDQEVRSIFDLKWTEGLSPVAADNWILAANTRMTAIDCDNTAWLKDQLIEIGWFTIPKYGAEVDSAAWHLVQHADREPVFQREMLAKLQALPAGQTDGKRLGMLFDRVARAAGHLQRYGTGGQCKDGQWTPFESEDPANLDRRRAALGMEPIAEYTRITSREACPH